MKIVMCIIFSCAKAAYLSLHMVEVRQIGHRTYERRDGGDRLARRVRYAHVDGGISHRRSDCNDSMTANSRARLCLVCAALTRLGAPEIETRQVERPTPAVTPRESRKGRGLA
jgi:hypothetical protein